MNVLTKWYLASHLIEFELFFRSPNSMPALNMKSKSTTTCKRDESYPHVSQKSNRISKLSCSMVRETHELVDLNTPTHMPENGFKNEVTSKEHENCKIQMSSTGDQTVVRNCLSWEVEDSGSIEKRDSLPFYHSSSLETMFSPFTGSNDVHCSLFDAVGREQIIPVPQADDNNSSNNQTYHMLDSYIYEMCLTGFSADRLSVFDDSVNCNIHSDHEFDGPNLIYDVMEGFMLFPSHEETVEATESHYEGSCEDSQQNSDYSWFHHMCHQTKPFTQDVGHSSFDSDEVDYSDPESFIRNFPELSDESSSLPALVSKETSKRKSITLVLDLDETLVHSTIEPCDGADFTIQVFFDKKEHTVYVRQRPFLQAFLDTVSEMFEIVIFTASQSIYAEKLLDVLDPDKKLFSRRVYRESCIFSDGSYTKDLTVLGVDLAKVVIVDNSPQVFRLQADNGIPIESWFDDPSDSALMSLLPFLETLVDVDDVRPIVAKKFRVRD